MLKRNHLKGNRHNGFTLIEMAVVILIVSLMLVVFARAYDQWSNTKRILTTQQRLEDIEAAIVEYIELQNMLPCPSSLVAPFSSATFGRALPLPLNPNDFPTTCVAAADPGTFDMPGRLLPFPVNVRIGAVPTAKLRDAGINITDEHAFDGWGRRFTYAATREMASSAIEYADNDGGIGVVDPAGNSLTANEPETAMYAIISHGPDGNGGHTYGGTLYAPCSTTAVDADNCDYLTGGDTFFTHSLLYSAANTVNRMDDYVGFTTKDLNEAPKVAAFIVEKMACNPQVANYGAGNHAFVFPALGHGSHQVCATDTFFLNDSFVDRPAGEIPLVDGQLLHSTTFEAVTSGKVYVRATIPLRFAPPQWDAPILASVYIGPIGGPLVEYKAGEVMNPTPDIGHSQGGTGVVLAEASITKGTTYDVQVYLYHICSAGSPSCGSAGSFATAGTIDLVDHIVDGVVEISQSGN